MKRTAKDAESSRIVWLKIKALAFLALLAV